MEHELAAWCRRVDSLCQRAEPYPALGQILGHVDQVPQTAPEAVEFPDGQDIALGQRLESGRELWAIVARS